uniref:FHA domain-containing protein n=1 Tax=Enterobacter hormaechei TaxID=158836 RepID=UPI00292FFE68
FCDGAPLGDDAVLGQPPLLDGCTLTLTEAAPRPPRRTRTTTGDAGCLLQVVSGPDAGRAVPLAAGGVVVGRGFGAGLELADPDVSRRHVMIRPARGSTGAADQGAGAVLGYLRDLGSTNGTVIEGSDGGMPVAGTEVQL